MEYLGNNRDLEGRRMWIAQIYASVHKWIKKHLAQLQIIKKKKKMISKNKLMNYFIVGARQMINLVNPLSANVALLQKPANWFAVQINWLVSIWGNTAT